MIEKGRLVAAGPIAEITQALERRAVLGAEHARASKPKRLKVKTLGPAEAGKRALATSPGVTIARADADQRVVHEGEAVAQRHAEVVGEFERRRAGAALLAVDHDEVRIDPGRQHRFADREELPRVADAELEARWLAA